MPDSRTSTAAATAPDDCTALPVPAASIAVVVPVHNEAANLEALQRRLAAVLDGAGLDWQVIYVDDGSRDASWELLGQLRAQWPGRIARLKLSRNFGKELALTAGLDHVAADREAVVVIDADLQDPPELIPQFVEHWRAGCDIVYGTRSARHGESWLKRATAAAFYRIIGRLSDTPIPPDTGDFRLLSRRALDALCRLRERHRFMKGLFGWVGFRQASVLYERDPRHAGRSSWNYWRLWNFALEGLTSFSTVPLRVAMYLGLFVALVAFVGGVWVIVKTLLFGEPVQGYPSLMVTILFLGGVQLVALGLIGEYLGRLYGEVKQRPLYLVEQFEPAAREASVPGGPPSR